MMVNSLDNAKNLLLNEITYFYNHYLEFNDKDSINMLAVCSDIVNGIDSFNIGIEFYSLDELLNMSNQILPYCESLRLKF